MSNQDKERAEFEEWAFDKNRTNKDGHYVTPYVSAMFRSWQASAERYQSRIAALEAEVERLKNIINNLGHGAGCRKNAFKECSCGLDEAMKGEAK